MNILRLSDGMVPNIEMLNLLKWQTGSTMRLAFSSDGTGFLMYRDVDSDLVNTWVAEQDADLAPARGMGDTSLAAWWQAAIIERMAEGDAMCTAYNAGALGAFRESRKE